MPPLGSRSVLRARRLRLDRLWARAGHMALPESPAALARDGYDAHCAAWEATAAHLGAAALPIRAVEVWPVLEPHDLIGLRALASTTLAEAIDALIRHFALITPLLSWRLVAVGDELRLQLSGRARSRGEALFIESELADAFGGARHLTAVALRPLRIELAHRDPGTAHALAAWFDCAVAHEAAHTQLVLTREQAALPSRFADAASAATLERGLRQARADMLGPCGRHVRELLGRGEVIPSAGQAARRLGWSERSLFRRLAAEGVALQSLVDDLRAERACALLASTTTPLTEISARLGFSEPSAFFRAFRRWTGLRPTLVRASTRDPVAAQERLR